VNEWLDGARERLAGATGAEPGSLDLTQADADELLELARVAAHESGERINAPLVCYLVGLAHARSEVDLSDLVATVVVKG
jgi:hypothetical protein